MEPLPPGLRDEVFRRAGYRCQRCGRTGSLTLSHKIARSRGGPWELWNLDALCGSGTTGCHGWVEANPAAAHAGGWRLDGSLLRGVYSGPDAERVAALRAADVGDYVPRLDEKTWWPVGWGPG